MERPHKRIKLMNRTDPSVPPEDGSSPFFQSCDDVAFAIFRALSEGEKNKMRMELVCRKFQSGIENRSSWEGEYELLRLMSGRCECEEHHGVQLEESIFINGFRFPFEKAPLALFKLLDRISLERLLLGEMTNIPEKVAFDLCHSIAKHNNFVNLKCIYFDTLENTRILRSIIGCGLQQLTKIECGDWYNKTPISSVSPHFYSLLSGCTNLKKFSFVIDDIFPIRLLLALANCHEITKIKIFAFEEDVNLSQQAAIEFARLCSSSFPKLTVLHFIPSIEMDEPFEFLDAFNESLLSNMTSFGIELDPGIASNGECLKTIFTRFPKLKNLSVSSPSAFSTETLLEAIGNIFETYRSHRTDIYEFGFDITAENSAELIFQLVHEQMDDNYDLVKIDSENDIWKCIKNNVRITLELNSDD